MDGRILVKICSPIVAAVTLSPPHTSWRTSSQDSQQVGGGAHGAKIRKRIQNHLIFILMGSHTLLGAHIYFHNLLTILAEFLLVLSCVCLTQEMLICCLFLKASESLQVSLCTIQQKPELILILKKMMIFYF